jgi:hypothetical protein
MSRVSGHGGGMSENLEDLPAAPDGLGGESDVVAERSGATTEKADRPIPADPPEALDPEAPDPSEEEQEPAEGEEKRPDAGPTS